ncbi:MAG: peptidoglycan-binding protein [Dehalococcoidia bacterium]|nr:peptidoglycan-binding protein [Dehalococcoidia bacterium]
MRNAFVSTLAILLGVAWTVAPAVAGNTAEKVKEKTESAMDKVKTKAREAKEKVTGKKDGVEAKAKNGDVRAAQEKLKLEGYDPGPIDGRMGPRTASAMRAYQKAEGLQQTGRLDQATMDKLGIQGGSALPGMPAEAQRP